MTVASPSESFEKHYGYTEHLVNLPGRSLQLKYLEWRPKNGGHSNSKTIFLLHGLGDRATVWSDLGKRLAEDNYHVVAPDLRGHGDSDKPESGYDFESIIDDLEDLIVALNIEQPIVAVGHSWAGKLVPIWVKRSPEKIAAQILVDPFFIERLPRISKLAFPLFYRVLPFLQMMGPFESRDAAETKAKGMKQYRSWSILQRHAFESNLEQKSDKTWGSKLAIAARNGIFEAVVLVSGLTERLNTPALVLIAEKGLNRSDWQLKPYQKYLANLTLKKLPGNHWLFLVDPESFSQEITCYLKQLKG
ncbi:MAG: alpha/beta hydrolase [Cyanobacteria bacterium P01_D01_bin.73]